MTIFVGAVLPFFNAQHSTLLACLCVDSLWVFLKQGFLVCMNWSSSDRDLANKILSGGDLLPDTIL